ncbi:MAG: ABC transporter permease [Phycisphaerales bacterium]
MTSLWQDVRQGLRMLVRSPGFTAAAALSLALGIGANTAIFSMAKTLLWTKLGRDGGNRVVAIVPAGQETTMGNRWSYPDYLDIRDRSREVFEDLIVMSHEPWAVAFHGSERSERWWGASVNSEYLRTMGVRPILGRTFTPDEDARPGEAPVAILSERVWQREFRRDPQILGRQIQLNRTWVTVVGVVPAEDAVFRRLLQVDFFLPIMQEGNLFDRRGTCAARDERWVVVAGRLRPKATRAQAQSCLDVLSAQLRQAYPQDWGADPGQQQRAIIAPTEELWGLPDFLPRHRVPAFACALFGLTGLVWLIACANVANLLLARAQARRRDIAVRLAVGGGRWRIIRQLLIESAMLSFLGGAAGILLAVWCQETVEAMSPSVQILAYASPVHLEFSLDRGVCCFALAITGLTAVVFGLLPAIRMSRVDLVHSLKEGGRSGGEEIRGLFWRRALIVGQMGMACLVLVGAGLFVRTVRQAMNDASGVDPRNLAVVSFDIYQQRYSSERAHQYVREALAKLERCPGVSSASFATERPLSPSSDTFYVEFEGSPNAEAKTVEVQRLIVGPTFFETTRIPMVRGRGFESQDWTERPKVVVVNEALAQRYWPGQDPIGRHVIVDAENRLEVVGIARAANYHSLAASPVPMCFVLPERTQMLAVLSFLVRTTGPSLSVLDRVRSELESLDTDMPIIEAATLEQVYADTLLPLRFAGWLGTAYACVALVMCAVGIYGLLAYYVVRRTREIGVRLALGAKPRDIMRLVLRQVLGLALVGMAVGLLAALALSHALRSLVFGVSTNDPVTFVLAFLVLGGVALAACLLPARRAARVDPMTALRCE